MAMEDWAFELLQWLVDSGDWIQYGSPNVVVCKGEFGPYGGIALLFLVYDEECGELYFVWDPQLQISSDVRSLYDRTIESLNNYIEKFEGGFGQFSIDEEGYVQYSVYFNLEFDELPLTAIGDVGAFAEEIYIMCGNMYLAILEVESGKNMEQVIKLACARSCDIGHA